MSRFSQPGGFNCERITQRQCVGARVCVTSICASLSTFEPVRYCRSISASARRLFSKKKLQYRNTKDILIQHYPYVGDDKLIYHYKKSHYPLLHYTISATIMKIS